MPKMTKSQCRKRLMESYDKINKVCSSGQLSRADMLALFKISGDLLKYEKKLRS